MVRWSRPAHFWIFVAALAFAVGLTVGVLWPDDSRDAPSRVSASERCLQWLADLENGSTELAEEQREQVRKMVRRGAFKTEEEALPGIWTSRREPCARAARFGLVGSDGSLGPLALDILSKCELFHFLESQPSDPYRDRTVRECRRIDEVIGRDPKQFG